MGTDGHSSQQPQILKVGEQCPCPGGTFKGPGELALTWLHLGRVQAASFEGWEDLPLFAFLFASKSQGKATLPSACLQQHRFAQVCLRCRDGKRAFQLVFHSQRPAKAKARPGGSWGPNPGLLPDPKLSRSSCASPRCLPLMPSRMPCLLPGLQGCWSSPWGEGDLPPIQGCVSEELAKRGLGSLGSSRVQVFPGRPSPPLPVSLNATNHPGQDEASSAIHRCHPSSTSSQHTLL